MSNTTVQDLFESFRKAGTTLQLGYNVWCSGDDFYEPEGGMLFNAEPKVGDKITLSDKKEWVITKVNNDELEVTCERPD